MEKYELSIVDIYTSKVYKIAMLMIPIIALCSSIVVTMLYYTNRYPSINEIALWIFNVLNLASAVIGYFYIKTGFRENGVVKPVELKHGKIATACFIFLHWNGLAYLCLYTDFWVYGILLVFIEMLFFDYKLSATMTISMSLSMILVIIVRSNVIVQLNRWYYSANLIIQIMCVFAVFISIMVTTYLGRKYLVDELEEYANYDTLTHLLNRRSMDDCLQDAHKQAKSGKSTYCLMMIDIDNLQNIISEYGKIVENEVLKYVASTISTGVKKDDRVFRLDEGEVLVLLKTDEYRTIAAAERIRKDIAKDPVVIKDGVEIAVTATIGIAPYRDGISVQQMINEADLKLYFGKRNGSNQVVSDLPDDKKKNNSGEEDTNGNKEEDNSK